MFSKEDLGKYYALAKVIDEGKFEVEGKAVITTALLLKWYADLGPKIKSCLAKQEVEKNVEVGAVEAKPIGDPIGRPIGEPLVIGSEE